jgi:hypothetical protein
LEKRNILAPADCRCHSQEQRPLRAGRDNQAVAWIHRGTRERGQPRSNLLADAAVAAIFRVSLRAAERDALGKQLERTGRRHMRIDVAMRKVDPASLHDPAAQQAFDAGRLLSHFLAGSVFRTQLPEFGLDRHFS